MHIYIYIYMAACQKTLILAMTQFGLQSAYPLGIPPRHTPSANAVAVAVYTRSANAVCKRTSQRLYTQCSYIVLDAPGYALSGTLGKCVRVGIPICTQSAYLSTQSVSAATAAAEISSSSPREFPCTDCCRADKCVTLSNSRTR